MHSIKILDASLRDGGHRTNFHFHNHELEEILIPLDNAGIEYIEIGYRNGSIHPIDDLGRAGFCAREYLLLCRSLIKKAKMAVMAHPANITDTDLTELKGCGVQLLRLCVAKNQLATALPLMERAKRLNLEVSLNFIHLSYYEETELNEVVKQAAIHAPDLIYFADSNGSLLPDSIRTVYERYTKSYMIPFGFHAHDNLGLAQANTLSAITAGARFIDSSLAGMGKGIGNLRTEFFVAYLQAIQKSHYDLEPLLHAANYVRHALKIGQEAVDMDEFTRGISDLSTADLKRFKADANPGAV